MIHLRKLIISNLLTAFLFTLFSALLSADCHSEEAQSQNEDASILRLVIIPEKSVFEQRRRYRFITDYLSKKMDMIVIIEIMANYGEISDAFLDGRADAGFFGSFSYVMTHAKVGIEPIARPVWLDGKSTYRGYIFVRKDSNIETVSDMKGKKLVLVDRATTAGYIFQLFYLNYYGIPDLDSYFSRISFARSHDAAAWAVYTGEADIGGAKDLIFNSMNEKYPDFKKEMMVLAESPEVPSNGLAVRKDLNPAIKLRLRNLLLNMHENTEGQEVLKNFGALKFIETKNHDYKVLYNMIERLGINLKDFPQN
ncbi:MAG: phosphate/phosphite/phosphonate ABC transporter substrate-binding protein [Deltaproteobacteria bacterium]|nr:MAG: phosphate/phosphite/phosphonate ABC transporter substrate-binding protein [Deltaproteobacteria bacterium]